MCWLNYSQHMGCGHYGPPATNAYSLCVVGQKALLDRRGPSSPPLMSPSSAPAPPPLKRSSTLGRFFESSVKRSASTTTARRAVSGPSGGTSASRLSMETSTVRFGLDVTPGSQRNATITDAELKAVLCKGEELKKRARVWNGDEINICIKCKETISDMRFMIERLDKTGSIKGTKAFTDFLQLRGEALGGKDKFS
ncbi:hypothetical protein K504DRAFT_468271 [Pleomassaria siparia CBS 279.74]|uniref:Uncharacterized protein n=1 Tax=Pleomassaria siparia CBS 279.74 TaxID=1314801 RepID=A0A6G1K8W7_9PLEO|nr:hypothetical protein K504DRAFT_468271 [Pleomassaria siparia CBS 279.74]